MTETEWLTSTNPKPMLEFLRGKASDRKLRLFASLCCRRVWEQHEPGSVQLALIASERAADGLVDQDELRRIERAIGAMGSYSAAARALDVARTAVHQIPGKAAEGASVCAADYFALTAMESVGEEAARKQAFAVARQLENIIQASLLRELFGNPFRPAAIDPSWLTSEVVELAHKSSDEPHSLQVLLGEALTRGGCDNAEILDHCRHVRGHVKGCWVIDLLLGTR